MDAADWFAVAAPIVASLAFGILSWLINRATQRVDGLEKRAEEMKAALKDLELDTARTYARRDEHAASIDKIDRAVERIFDRLDDISQRLPPKQ